MERCSRSFESQKTWLGCSCRLLISSNFDFSKSATHVWGPTTNRISYRKRSRLRFMDVIQSFNIFCIFSASIHPLERPVEANVAGFNIEPVSKCSDFTLELLDFTCLRPIYNLELDCDIKQLLEHYKKKILFESIRDNVIFIIFLIQTYLINPLFAICCSN